jgi:hypothetical protein
MTGRNTKLHAAILELLDRHAKRLYATDPGPFNDRVHRRLEVGHVFGDAFLQPGWDGIAELEEELDDAAAYIVLEAQRLQRSAALTVDIGASLVSAGAHVVAAYRHAQLSRHHRGRTP